MEPSCWVGRARSANSRRDFWPTSSRFPAIRWRISRRWSTLASSFTGSCVETPSATRPGMVRIHSTATRSVGVCNCATGISRHRRLASRRTAPHGTCLWPPTPTSPPRKPWTASARRRGQSTRPPGASPSGWHPGLSLRAPGSPHGSRPWSRPRLPSQLQPLEALGELPGAVRRGFQPVLFRLLERSAQGLRGLAGCVADSGLGRVVGLQFRSGAQVVGAEVGTPEGDEDGPDDRVAFGGGDGHHRDGVAEYFAGDGGGFGEFVGEPGGDLVGDGVGAHQKALARLWLVREPRVTLLEPGSVADAALAGAVLAEQNVVTGEQMVVLAVRPADRASLVAIIPLARLAVAPGL